MPRFLQGSTGGGPYRGFMSADSPHSLPHMLQAAQFGHEMAAGGSSWQFSDEPGNTGRILKVGTPAAPSPDAKWAVGYAPSVSNPAGQPSQQYPPAYTRDPQKMLDLYDTVKANTPADSVPRGVGGWVGKEPKDDQAHLHVDHISLEPGRTAVDEQAAYRITARRGEAAMFNPSVGALRYVEDEDRKPRPV